MDFVRTVALDDIRIRSGGDGRTVEAYAAVFDDPAWYGGSGSTFENTVGAQLALVQQGSSSPAQALSAIKDQLATYLNTPSPL
jgi:multiple sugar transport system substrate-binding protein